LIMAGALWISITFTHLAWYGPSPIGLYRSLDQPPILLTLVGVWYTARGVQGSKSIEPSEAEANPLARSRSLEEGAPKGGEEGQ